MSPASGINGSWWRQVAPQLVLIAAGLFGAGWSATNRISVLETQVGQMEKYQQQAIQERRDIREQQRKQQQALSRIEGKLDQR